MNNITYQHWMLEIDNEKIAWLTLDRAGEAVNSLSREVFDEFDQVLDVLVKQSLAGLVITSGKKKGFIAGADIKQFTHLTSEDEAYELIRQAQRVLDKLEALSIPTLALINGFCLGGGYELALACRYRIALNEPATKIGLPEVKLGIHPGWGGTVRLPRLIGAVKAMQIMLQGRAVSARAAKKMGMVDAALPARQLKRAARDFIIKQPTPRQMTWQESLSNVGFIRPFLAKKMRKSLQSFKVNPGHYPAPYAIVDNWVRDYGSPNAMENEARSIAKLMLTDTARNLLRVFFLDGKMKELGKQVKFVGQHVHVIGAGTMGGDIAAWCALQGFRVTLQDQTPKQIAPAIKRAFKLFKKKLKKPRLIQTAMDRLQPDVEGHGVRGADIIIEAVFENLEVKQKIFQQLEAQAKPEALLATNTSSIPLEDIASVLKTPSRLVGVHFFNPVAKMMLVEVVYSADTQPDLIAKAASFITRIKRSPLAVLSKPGFLVNRVLMPYLMEAMSLIEEGVAPELIDQAAVDFGMPMGPVELADKVGLDICLSVANNLTSFYGGLVPEKLKLMVNDGKLGMKTQSGFYEYNKAKPVKATDADVGSRVHDITDRLILRMVNEAVACLHESVVTDKDLLDAGMIYGTGFAPFRGGPIHYAEHRGLKDVVLKLESLAHEQGERFKPKAGWEILLGKSDSCAAEGRQVDVVTIDKQPSENHLHETSQA